MKDYLKEAEEGFSPLLAIEEASRCLLCHDAPCSKNCPAGTDPARFIRALRFLNEKGAAEVIRENNALGAICARVCPQEKYCKLGCSRSGIDKPIEIGRIQRYITDFEANLKMDILKKPERELGQKVAIIGSGPAALELAALLRMKGYGVTIFEKDEKLGGYLRYGIPSYRLPNDVLDLEIKRILDLGVEHKVNHRVNDEEFKKLKEQYDAVIVATGYELAKTLPMFENHHEVELATQFLKRAKEMNGDIDVYSDVLVIGGGDVAMDVVTTLKRIGTPRVIDVVYEEFSEFRASEKELAEARAQNVSIIDGYVPMSYDGITVNFKHRHLDSVISIKPKHIILAVGQVARMQFGLDYEAGEVKTTNYRVGDSNVFVIGDIAHGDKTVVGAVKTAKEASYFIDNFLTKERAK